MELLKCLVGRYSLFGIPVHCEQQTTVFQCLYKFLRQLAKVLVVKQNQSDQNNRVAQKLHRANRFMKDNERNRKIQEWVDVQ